MPRFSRRQLTIGGALVVALAGIGLSIRSLQSKSQGTAKIFKVQRKAIVQSLQLSGKVMPEQTMVITAQQSGRIIALAVKEGAKVKAGDLLFTMQLEAAGQTELQDLRSRVKSLEHEVASATRLVNNKNLVKELIGVDQVAREQSALERQRIELAAARERLSIVENNLGLAQKAPKASDGSSGLVYVRSPTQGIVTLVDKRPGDFVLGGAGIGGAGGSETGGANDRMVMVVADMTNLQVRIRVMEADLRFIKQGLPVKVRLDAYPDIAYDGQVQQIGGQGRAEYKAGYTYFDVYVGINQRDTRLLPEMNASVDLIFAQQNNALTLPVAGVLILPSKSFVRIADSKDSKGFRYQAIETGAVNATDVEIKAGLNEGDAVMEVDFSSPQIFDVAEAPETKNKGAVAQ